MNPTRLIPLAFLGLIAASKTTKPVASAPSPIIADYVEARTASVFCGACHYNGERVIGGREAVFAIRISSGSWNGIDLTGVTAAGETVCEDNLAEATAGRHTTLIVNRAVTDRQAAAVADFLRAESAGSLGTISLGGRTEIRFKHDADGYRVDAAGFADLTVRPMPDNACCTQPHLVWYMPLVGLEHGKVGFTAVAEFTGSDADGWQRSEENSAFYGTVSSR